VSVVAAAGFSLALDWLPSWIDAASVCADRATKPARVTGPVGIHVLEVVHLVSGNTARRTVGVGRQHKRDTVSPASAYFRGEQIPDR